MYTATFCSEVAAAEVLEKSKDSVVVVVVRFYTVLFSALEQTHCSCMRFYTSE